MDNENEGEMNEDQEEGTDEVKAEETKPDPAPESVKAARTFIYDGRTQPDPDPSLSPEKVKELMSAFYPELANAEIREHKAKDGSSSFEFIKKIGVKG